MKMHSEVVNKILKIYELYGGRSNNSKLMQELSALDLSVYSQKENKENKTFLVLTETLAKANIQK